MTERSERSLYLETAWKLGATIHITKSAHDNGKISSYKEWQYAKQRVKELPELPTSITAPEKHGTIIV